MTKKENKTYIKICTVCGERFPCRNKCVIEIVMPKACSIITNLDDDNDIAFINSKAFRIYKKS